MTHGCFGSSLAYSDKSAACTACPSRTECRQLVNDRYPLFLKLLARFSDGSGKTMAEAWLSPADKKRLRDRRKANAQREAETAVFGSPAAAQALRSSIDDRAVTHLDKCIANRVNPTTAPLGQLMRVSKPIQSALQALQSGAQHRDTIERAIASSSALSATTAKRETSAVLSLLKRCNRITETNNIVEIK